MSAQSGGKRSARDAAREHMFPGGRLSDEGHRALARLAERVPSANADAARLCDCGHPEEAHALPGTWPGGTRPFRWCNRCSCTRYAPDGEE